MNIYRAKYWGALLLAEDFADKEQTVYVIAERFEDAVSLVKKRNDEFAIFRSVVQVGDSNNGT
ncbi:MAG: hypothetical protein V4555_17785, partial [Acidobacteriota bacterium]